METNDKIVTDKIVTPIYHAVVYTDGSAGPTNPGFWGSGIHGYIYNVDKLNTKTGDKPNNYIISDIGYIESVLATKTEYQTVTPECYIDGYVSFQGTGTNNRGELYAIIETLKEIVNNEYNITKLMINSDSTYSLGTYNKCDNPEYIKRGPSNLDLVQLMATYKKLCKDNGIDVTMVKVEAHSTVLGNNIADRLAFLGRYYSSLHDINKTEIIYTVAKKYWKPKIEKHPMVPYRNVYFVNAVLSKPMYIVFNYKSDVEPGKKSHEASFGLVYPSEAIQEIDFVSSSYNKHMRNISVISKINLDALYQQFNKHYINIFGDKVFVYNNRGRRYMSVLEAEPICVEVHPSGLANTAYEKVVGLDRCLLDYRNKDNKICYPIDLTKILYEDVTKGKVTTKAIKIDNITKHITVEYITTKGVSVTIPLQFDRDIIPRNSLKKLEKLEPIITLLVYEISEACIEYYVVIETLVNKDISIWCNMFSNKVYLPVPKVKKNKI